MDEGNNEAFEERMTIEFSNLGIGALYGDIRCECGLDLIIYEAFIRSCILKRAWYAGFITGRICLMATSLSSR